MSRVFMLLDLNKNVICANEAFYPTHDAKRPHGGGVKCPPVWQSNLQYLSICSFSLTF